MAKVKDKTQGTVTVACKLPHGIFMQLYEMEEFPQEMAGGLVRVSKRAVPVGERIRLHGNAVPYGKRPKFRIVADYALTPNVPAAFWEKWSKDNADMDAVKNKLIFAYHKADDAVAASKDNRERRSGLEPLVPDTDPRRPRSSNKAVSEAKTAEDDE